MKVGVVCEGVTDFLAIKHYVGFALSNVGVDAEFVALQPNPDNTSGGGWPQVLTWLLNNTPELRRPLFYKGLFENSSRLSGLDVLLIQMDTDIIPEEGFRNFSSRHGYIVGNPSSIPEKASEISNTLLHFAKISETDADLIKKHVTAPIAESSEAWCVAADGDFDGDPEKLIGQALIDAFGCSLARFTKNPIRMPYRSINKSVKSRDQYCAGTADKYDSIKRCTLFEQLIHNLSSEINE